METHKHLDEFGNPISIGDTVFFCVPTMFYPHLAKGKVIRFTPKQAEVEYVSDIGGLERIEKSLFPCDRLALLKIKEKTMKRWIVTAVDHDTDGNCDGKARVLSVFKTHEEAKNYVDEDIKEWIDQRADEGCECDFDKMAAWYDYDAAQRREWNIEEVEIDD